MIRLSESDINALAAYFPDLDLTDEERKAVLLCDSSADVQAAPGSGKTTLLGIKLALLASKWTEPSRGICVLSHTNVARAEIEERLAKIPGGTALLQYPHFVGTIQSFVHTFLALPLLRSSGIKVEFVDNDRFTKRANALGRAKREICAWLSRPNMSRSKALDTLRFEGADLELGSAEGVVPKTGVTRPILEQVKHELAQEGLFRYDDMFAFAQHVLAKWPSTSSQLSYRFPLVFIDEMQDTDGAADQILREIFDKSVVMQRFGDVNQAILSRSEQGTSTFPVQPYLNVSGSMRFGTDFADIASKLRTEGPVITGQGKAALSPVTFLAYTDATVAKVISHFGDFVAEIADTADLDKGVIKAIGARQKAMEKPRVGSNLSEYWPTYAHQDSVPQPTRQTIAQLFASVYSPPKSTTQLTSRINAAQIAFIRLLRLAGCAALEQAHNWRQLEALWGSEHQCLMSLRKLALSCAVGGRMFNKDELDAVIRRFCIELSECLPPGVTPEALLAEDDLQIDAKSSPVHVGTNGLKNVHRVVSNGKSFPVGIGTIASVKGETHFATLVLESFNTRSFDVSAVLPLLCGEKTISDYIDDVSRSHIKNLFVATSRPSKLLCLAVHQERLKKYEEKIKTIGWQIRQV